MNKKSLIAQITAYVITILIVFAVILSHGTLTLSRVLLAVFSLILGVAGLILLNRLADKDISLRPLLDKEIKGQKLSILLGFAGVTVIAVLIRLFYFDYVSPDVAIFQENWYATAKEAGMASLGMGISDYPPLYTTIFCLLCQLPLSMLFVTKFIPILFDFVLALGSVLLFNEARVKATPFEKLIVYSVILLNPLIVINASAWGQCDTIYASFIVFTLYVLLKMYKGVSTGGDLAFILLGIAFACKFQTILFIPAILFFWIMQKKKVIRLSYFVWIPVMYFASCIPMFLSHRTIQDLLGIYFFQTGQYDSILSLNYPNFYSFIGNVSSGMTTGSGKYGMLLGVCILLLLYLYFFKAGKELSPSFMLKITMITVFVLTFFLPSMHERYAIVGEIILLILACMDKTYIPYAIVTVICTTFAYADFLLYYYEIEVPADWVIAAVKLAVLSILIAKVIKEEGNVSEQLNA